MRSLFIKFDCPYITHLWNIIYVIYGRDDLLYKGFIAIIHV
jgi:hypothetical protein